MRPIGRMAASVAVLGTGLMLGGCTWFDSATARMTDGLSGAGARIGAPWGSQRAASPEQSTTIARLTGAPMQVMPLRAEEGDVWPVPEGPRSTLANPDAAMRNIPNYRPGELDRPSAPAPRSQWQPTDPAPPAPLPPGLTGSSSPPPPPIRQPELPQARAVAPPLPNRNAPPPRRLEGQVIQTPQGPATLGPGTDRIQNYTIPGVGSGTAIIDGNNTTLTSPTAPTQVVPTPR